MTTHHQLQVIGCVTFHFGSFTLTGSSGKTAELGKNKKLHTIRDIGFRFSVPERI